MLLNSLSQPTQRVGSEGNLDGTVPSAWQKLQDRLFWIPTQEQVSSIYQASTERIRHTDYRRDIGKPKWIWPWSTMLAIHT